MIDSNPFKIRLELLQMAKDLLMDEYYSQKERLLEQWRADSDFTKKPLPIPDYPPYPTEHDILQKANALNGFISKGK